MAFMNRTSLHLALYESAYATTPKGVETTVSKIPKVGFKILVGHVKSVMKDPFAGDGTKSAREHVERIEDMCYLFGLPGISEDQVKKSYCIFLYVVMLVIGTCHWMKKSLLNGVS